REQAERLSVQSDTARAAAGLLAAGPRNAVVTLGAAAAILRGELRAAVPGAAAQVVDASGAGDALLGVLIARLGQSRYYTPTLAAALPDGVREAARTTERWG